MNDDTSQTLLMMALAAIGIIVALFLFFVPTPAGAVECHANKDAKTYWAWRQIDGRRCWYRGRRGLEKSQLHWPTRQHAPAQRVKIVDPKEFNELDALADANPKPLITFPDLANILNRWWDRWK